MYPKLKFRISYKKDIKTFYCFLADAEYDNGRNLRWAIFKKYPQLRKYQTYHTFQIEKKAVTAFVKNIYQKNASIIRSNLRTYQNNWQKIEKNYFALMGVLFDPKFWPSGKYIAYPTIWGMYPRFLKDKTFQMPYKYPSKKYVNVIIAHEMLHFIFYNYLFIRHPKYKNDKYDFLVWHISEIFNTLVQNSPRWLRLFQIKSKGYPEHKKILVKLKKYYKVSNWNIDKLIQDIIRIVKISSLRQ